MKHAMVFALASCLLAAPGIARVSEAKIPDPRSCELPATILGGSSGAALPTPRAGCTGSSMGSRFLIREVSYGPMPFCAVRLQFTSASIRLLGEQESGTTLDCAARTLERLTGPDGTVVFHPRFAGSDADACVEVSAEGVVLALLPAVSTDVDGVNGETGLGDLARMASAFLDGKPDPALDLAPCDGIPGRVGLDDFAVFAREFLAGGRGTPCP